MRQFIVLRMQTFLEYLVDLLRISYLAHHSIPENLELLLVQRLQLLYREEIGQLLSHVVASLEFLSHVVGSLQSGEPLGK